MAVEYGVVYLIGAGPGDPGLLTLRGAECLRRAQVVIYDRLVHPDLLRHAPATAERIYVGKEADRHTLKQEEINALLIANAQSGKTVCRLKGGDPFVFGRGGEEAEACRSAGIPFEIVPGITSAIAAPAYAGIPVTHRDVASSFAVITGHERDDSRESGARRVGRAEGRRNWAYIAHAADTLLFLMGVENLEKIAARLQENGRDLETPVALIRWGTWRRQQTLVSTLANVVEDARRVEFGPPAVLIVGEVVRLRERLGWFDTKPLFGKRVLVTRAREQASALTELLREQGAETLEFPVIRIAPLEEAEYAALDGALIELSTFDKGYAWVVFTSANAVRAVQARLETIVRDARVFGAAKIAAIGPATGEALLAMGLRADFVPTQFVAESVIEEWPDRNLQGRRVLLPRAREARDLLPDALCEMGAAVDVLPAYETVMEAVDAEGIRAVLEHGEIDIVTFTSSSTVRNFVESLGPEQIPSLLQGVTVACIGPITAQTARELGITPNVVAAEHTIPGLVAAVVEKIKSTQYAE